MGFDWKIHQTAGLSHAWWANKKPHSSLRFTSLQRGTEGVGNRSESLKKRRLSSDETTFWLGAGGWCRRDAEESRPGSHGAGNRRQRDRRDGRRLHGMDSRLCQAYVAVTRAVLSPLAGRTRDSRRYSWLCRTQIVRENSHCRRRT